MVWRRDLVKKLGINRYLPGQSRGATLAIKVQMDQIQEGGQGLTKRQGIKRHSVDYDHCQPSPRMEEALQRLPTTWPRCLGRGAPICSFLPPLPTPSSTSSNSSEPPSLESLTELESGYEASVSSDLSSDLE